MSDHPEPQQLSAFLDAELSDAERSAVEQHVTSCDECSTTLAALRATLADLATLPEVQMPAEHVAALDAAIARVRTQSERPRRARVMHLAWAAGGGVAAALIALALIVSNPARHNIIEKVSGGVGAADQSATNYSEATARQALLAFASSGAGTTAGAANSETTNGAAKAAPNAAVPLEAPAFTYLQRAERCDAEIRAGSSEPATLARTESASFKGTPALLLYYFVPANAPKRAELWIVRPSDCFTLFFAQTPLKR